MRKYHLFIIKKAYTDSDPDILFQLLSSLSKIKSNFNFGLSFYEQLCLPFNVNLIKEYLIAKGFPQHKNTFYLKGITVKVRASRLVVKSYYNLPLIIKILNYTNKNIFVCDFKNNDYFWLDQYINNKTVEYV